MRLIKIVIRKEQKVLRNDKRSNSNYQKQSNLD